jgi:hypothetical protein
MARIKQIKPIVRVAGEPEISAQLKAQGIFTEAIAKLEAVDDDMINLSIPEYKIKISLDMNDFIKAFLDARTKYIKIFKDRSDTNVSAGAEI